MNKKKGNMFFKKKVTASEIANNLELMSFGGDILEDKNNCKKYFGEEQLTENQLQELLIFNMFAHTKAFDDVFNGDEVSHAILDKLHDKIYSVMFNLPPDPHTILSPELMKFEHILQLRYKEYYKCFEVDDRSELMPKIGKALSKHLYGETEEPLAFLKVGAYAMGRLMAKYDLAKSANKKFKIIIDS